ncbi:hypothetical protein L1987_64431 [Smallanthus sonchifolius]|uniref:Uncharacterized protein n=1 Tax=Smallanthus sonchifolius TaxID=185202 RepID=A0ACB9CG43_9ASTR|nr:hypothetical protein L1987_64431 [Smallanthus sonchifolius]
MARSTEAFYLASGLVAPGLNLENAEIFMVVVPRKLDDSTKSTNSVTKNNYGNFCTMLVGNYKLKSARQIIWDSGRNPGR